MDFEDIEVYDSLKAENRVYEVADSGKLCSTYTGAFYDCVNAEGAVCSDMGGLMYDASRRHAYDEHLPNGTKVYVLAKFPSTTTYHGKFVLIVDTKDLNDSMSIKDKVFILSYGEVAVRPYEEKEEDAVNAEEKGDATFEQSVRELIDRQKYDAVGELSDDDAETMLHVLLDNSSLSTGRLMGIISAYYDEDDIYGAIEDSVSSERKIDGMSLADIIVGTFDENDIVSAVCSISSLSLHALAHACISEM